MDHKDTFKGKKIPTKPNGRSMTIYHLLSSQIDCRISAGGLYTILTKNKFDILNMLEIQKNSKEVESDSESQYGKLSKLFLFEGEFKCIFM
jgi:hypothetical protein